MTATTLQALASEVRAQFIQDKRTDGTPFWKLSDNAPAWLQDWAPEMCHAAHGDMLPDDWRYAFIVESLDALAESEDPDDADVEADLYTHELTAWLASRADRYGYCDQFVEDTGSAFMGTVQLLSWGQYTEKREVLDAVRAALTTLLD